MDFKKLISKIDQLESKKILTEGATSTVQKQDASYHLVESLGLDSSKQVAESSMGSIARALLEEFGLTEATNPWPPGSKQAKAWDALTPQDQEWLGSADPLDPAIIARAPNKGIDAAASSGQGIRMPQTAQPSKTSPADVTSADTTPGAVATPIPTSSVKGTPLPPIGSTTKMQQGNKPGQSSQSTASVTKKFDPAIAALQTKLKAAGADLGATGPKKDGVDGIMGPKTQTAMKKFPQVSSTAAAQSAQATPSSTATTAPAAVQRGVSAAAKRELDAQVAKNPKLTKWWINGERYKLQSVTDNDGQVTGNEWVVDYSDQPGREAGSTGISKAFTSGLTQARAKHKYSGTDMGSDIKPTTASPAATATTATSPNAAAMATRRTQTGPTAAAASGIDAGNPLNKQAPGNMPVSTPSDPDELARLRTLAGQK